MPAAETIVVAPAVRLAPVGAATRETDGSGRPAVEVTGGTLLDPRVWGTGVDTEVKRLLLAVLFERGAEWVQLRLLCRQDAATRRRASVRMCVR